MKKICVTMMITLAALGCVAQGTILFANSSSSQVRCCDPETGIWIAAPVGAYTVGLWWAPAGTFDSSQFMFLADSATIVRPTDGYFNGGNKTINGIPPGAVVAVQVRAWETAAGSYDAAIGSGRWFGRSQTFTVDTGDPTSIPPGTPSSLDVSGFKGLYIGPIACPEPSTVALGILGLAACLAFKSRQGNIKT